MAAVVLKDGEEFDGVGAYKQVAGCLPSYARPRFIRVQVGTDKVAPRAIAGVVGVIGSVLVRSPAWK